MRIGLSLLVVALAGCAAAPSPAPAPVTRQVKIDNSNVEAVQHAGYKIVNKNGDRLYCRTDAITGSRIQTHTTCLTESEMIEQNEVTRQSMERFNNISPGTKGN
jgi:hypothetical protein